MVNPKIIKKNRPGNWWFDESVQKMGFCCRLGYLRLNLLNRDTIRNLAERADVAKSTITRCRSEMVKGNLKCEYRETCLRAIWMTAKQRRDMDAERGKSLPTQQGSTAPPPPIKISEEHKD